MKFTVIFPEKFYPCIWTCNTYGKNLSFGTRSVLSGVGMKEMFLCIGHLVIHV